MPKKPTFEEFNDWAKGELGFDPEDKTVQNWVGLNVASVRASVEKHGIVTRIAEFIGKNQAATRRANVNIVGTEFRVHEKSYSSILSKLYRLNVLENRKFPLAPKGGWIKPETIFGELNDLVRSTIVCRHINEPAIIAQKILGFAEEEGLKASSTAQTKEEGYYAYHVYIGIPVNLMDRAWTAFDQAVSFEIQITTEMQHMLYELTHTFYDRERHKVFKDRNSWKWDYRSARFSASYLSHTLHLLEGLILQLHEEIESGEPTAREDAEVSEKKTPAEGLVVPDEDIVVQAEGMVIAVENEAIAGAAAEQDGEKK